MLTGSLFFIQISTKGINWVWNMEGVWEFPVWVLADMHSYVPNHKTRPVFWILLRRFTSLHNFIYLYYNGTNTKSCCLADVTLRVARCSNGQPQVSVSLSDSSPLCYVTRLWRDERITVFYRITVWKGFFFVVFVVLLLLQCDDLIALHLNSALLWLH